MAAYNTRQYGGCYYVGHSWGLLAVVFIGACYLYNLYVFVFHFVPPLLDEHFAFVMASTAVFVPLFALTIYSWMCAIFSNPGDPRFHNIPLVCTLHTHAHTA
jgi:hypothetical protein